MASSRNSSRSSAPDLGARVAAQLAHVVKPSDRLLLGLSGGVDSVVLLDCLQRSARKLQFTLSALHVNHQLSPNAARWSAFCRRVCRARGVAFVSVKVKVPGGDSVEAAARAARYAVFCQQSADYVVLAQHQDDQVETLLLQLLRGAGVKGLAAMPLVRREEGRGSRVEGTTLATRHSTPDTRHSTPDTRHSTPDTRHPTPDTRHSPLVTRHSTLATRHSTLGILRPLLDVTRAEIEEYARRRGLEWIEDESNDDTYFLRNYLRHEVLPVIARRFPAYRATVARSARHVAEAADLLDELAASDGAGYIEGGALAVDALRRLPPARGRNLLRYFLASRGVSMPNAERLDEALRQALSARQDARVLIELGDATLRRFAGRLHVVQAGGALRAGFSKRWRGESEIALPELGGVLVLSRGRGAGISIARLQGRPVTIRIRRGGERLQPDCRRPRRTLKNLLQEARILPWERERLPLIFCGEKLVWAPGIGVACAFQAARGEAALQPGWMPWP